MPDMTTEKGSAIQSYASRHSITITRCKIEDAHWKIHLIDVVRGIRIIDSKISQVKLTYDIGDKDTYQGNQMCITSLLVENVTAVNLQAKISANSPVAFGWIKFVNSVFQGDSSLTAEQNDGFLTLHIENCTFLDVGRRSVAIKLTAFQAFITGCRFDILDGARCPEGGCALNVQRSVGDLIYLYYIFNNLSNLRPWSLIVEVSNTVFIGSAGVSGGAIFCKDRDLTLKDCVFTMKENSQPPSVGGFIYFVSPNHSYLRLTKVILNSSALSSPMTVVSIIFIDSVNNSNVFNNVQLLCPNSFRAMETVLKKYGEKRSYFCEQTCKNDQYTFHAGMMTLEGQSSPSHQNISVHKFDPTCFRCPLGAECLNNIEALPNYWGFKNQSGFVRMIRCPEGYCCEDDETCEGIDSCNKNRDGILCGFCDRNWTESLFSPECIPVGDCQVGLILVLYILTVIVYSVGLMVFRTASKKTIMALKKIYESVKFLLTRKHRVVETEQDTTENETEVYRVSSAEVNEEIENIKRMDCNVSYNTQPMDQTDEDDMKYIQILFYYVQDASLFKVKLPGVMEETESIVVKILQFSPDILKTVYNNVSNLCFSPGTTAVTKILLKSLFGPCVMLFLLVLYLIQKGISKYMAQQFPFWKSLKMCLMRAFLLALLFSYQQIVIGAFTLVQCVEIDDKNVLYSQGDIECYTWWQIVTKFYVYLGIVPTFFVLSAVPYHLQDKKISIRMFIFACLFPVPVMIFYYSTKLYKSRKTKCCSSKLGGSEINSDSRVKLSILFQGSPSDPNLPVANISLDTLGQDDASSDTDIGSEYSTDMMRIVHHDTSQTENNGDGKMPHLKNKSISMCKTEPQADIVEPTSCRNVILSILLKHYKSLRVFGVRFTWLGIHKIYRVLLVACNTYITEPLPRLFVMTLILVGISVSNTLLKPYKDKKANTTAILSYAANLCIAIINLWKTALITFDCKTNCPYKTTVLWYLGKSEDVLLIYAPLAAVGLWFLYTGVQKCRNKSKEEWHPSISDI